MGGKTFDQFYKELIIASQRSPITMEDALAMAWRAGLENGVSGGTAEEPEGEATSPDDAAASRLLRSMSDDPRMP